MVLYRRRDDDDAYRGGAIKKPVQKSQIYQAQSVQPLTPALNGCLVLTRCKKWVSHQAFRLDPGQELCELPVAGNINRNAGRNAARPDGLNASHKLIAGALRDVKGYRIEKEEPLPNLLDKNSSISSFALRRCQKLRLVRTQTRRR
jgi:hypothetical protein